jgi:DNA replication protein DnaC
VVAGKVEIVRIEHRCGAGQALQNRRLEIVDHDFGRHEFQRYLKPAVLIVDEVGYLPIDKHGADLLFQIISQRYERAPMVITTNRAYKHWAQIFNNDSMLTSAILDRVLHHADTVIIEGKSFRMKDEIEE